MRNIIILLFICSLSYGQSTARYEGKTVRYQGKTVRIQADNIPTSPENPPASTFDGTVYRQVTFSEVSGTVPRENSLSDIQTYFASSDIARYEYHPDSSYTDSCVIMTNDGGYTDTIWKVRHTEAAWAGGSGYGSSPVGHFNLNGTNGNDDTLTQLNATAYLMLGEEWDWENSTGGKLGGFMASDIGGSYAPSGGVHDCDCDPEPADYTPYCSDDGITIRGSYDFYGDECGVYAYTRRISDGLNCTSKRYADSWSKSRIASDEAEALHWELGKWYKITIRIDIGTAGNTDGYIQWARNDTVYWTKENIRIIDNSGIKIDSWYWGNFAGGAPEPSFKGHNAFWDDITLWREDDMTAFDVGDVMTNVPDMKTPNTE